MADRTSRIADFIAEECQEMDRDAALGAVIQQWPDATADETSRAFQIALELAHDHLALV